VFFIGLDELVAAIQTLFEQFLNMDPTRAATYFGFMIVHVCRLSGGKIGGI
jgi:hypothetical protein